MNARVLAKQTNTDMLKNKNPVTSLSNAFCFFQKQTDESSARLKIKKIKTTELLNLAVNNSFLQTAARRELPDRLVYVQSTSLCQH